MNRFSLWLRWHDVRLCGIPLERFHQESRLRHLMWPLLRLRLQLLYMETRLNYGGKVKTFHRWLRINVQSSDYLTVEEFSHYLGHLRRLQTRAHEQDLGTDVRTHRRANRGWLSFCKPPQVELRIEWPRI